MDERLNPTALLLVQKNFLSLDLAWQYQQEAQARAQRLLPYLLSQAQLCPKMIAQLIAEHFGFPWINLDDLAIQDFPKRFLTPTLLRRHHVLPIQYQNQQLCLAIDDPNHPIALKEIQFLTQCPIQVHIASSTQLSMLLEEVLRHTDQQGLTHYLHHQAPNAQTLLGPSHPPSDLSDEGPIVLFVQRLLQQAIARRATDLHLEPYADHYRIRYRQDGKLYELTRPTPILAPRIVSRLKIMANLNITEHRLPQDGRFSFNAGQRVQPSVVAQQTDIDCRINTCPTIYGEKVVIRFLNAHIRHPQIEHLDLSERDKNCVLQAIQRPHGLILVTGPTGSGKTLTLYAVLNHLNTGDKNISTIEDPVEIKLYGINQVQINPNIGLGFAEVLRAFLRQDPDVIMLGEIRDYETADMAMKAAQTGHLVLSTLHTQNCVQTLIRLKQLGIPAFLLSNLILIMAQRLIRILCPHCKTPGVSQYAEISYQAQGCHRCHQGYQGRKAIFEVMPISEALQNIFMQPKVSRTSIALQAAQEGMLSLRQAGILHIMRGVTTDEEIHAHT